MTVFTDTTETLTKMIPVAVAGGMLHRATKRAAPARRKRRAAPAKAKRRPVSKRKAPKRRTARRGRRK